MSALLYDRIAIIGLGQMGASIALALKAGGRIGPITGYDTNPRHSATALSIEAIDTLAATLEETVREADLVILCTPVGAYSNIIKQIAPHLKEGCVLTDIGSIKKQAIRDVLPHLPKHVNFVPSHPVAGSEKVGPYEAHGEFFKRHLFLITPLPDQDEQLIGRIGELWHSTGALVDAVSADQHDRIYAYMSHIPQLMAFAAMPVLDHYGMRILPQDNLFKRFTRIGKSDPEMWRDVFIENAENVLGAAESVKHILSHMRDELISGTKAKEQEASAPDAETLTRLAKACWPRILASSLIMSVKLYEEQTEQSLVHYAAGGFGDFSAPATQEPEDDLQFISDHATHIIAMIDQYLQQQQKIVQYLASADRDHLLAQLAVCQACGKRLHTVIH